MADYTRARRHLMRQDPKLRALIKEVGPCQLGHGPERPAFVTLSYSIASQQLSVKAADTIFNRFCDLFPPDRIPDPAQLVSMHPDTIRAVGFSRPKVGFLQDLAARVVDGRLPLPALHALPDEEVLQTLTAVKGIGRWTAEVFLMFRLGRQDVFPADDLGLVKAVQRVYGLRKKPSRERLMKIAEPWRPYRSVAAWYLWRSLSIV
jgi:3-methyladenine DNA glycosylase/8-oxoguanine DNA glycosylase